MFTCQKRHGQIQRNKNCIDDTHRRTKEIVVVPRDEFADFVNKYTKTYSSYQRNDSLDSLTKKRKIQHKRNHHEYASPQHVGDMVLRATYAWVASEI